MRELNTNLSRWLLGGSIYLTAWYYEGPALQVAQMGAICLLLLAGFFSALSGDTLRIRPTVVEWLLGIAFLFAMLVAWMTGNLLSTMYGAMLLLVLLAIAFLIRHSGAAELIVVFRWAYVAIIGTLLLLEPQALFESLSGSVRYGHGLVRYQPLGMHPNLSGLVYGGGALLFFQSFLASVSLLKKMLSLAVVAICLCVVLAASARASLLALGVTGVVATLLLAGRGSSRVRMVLAVSVFVILGVGLFKADDIVNYLTIILDLDSPTRGVNSGATGRTDIWRDGIELVFSDPVLLFTGRGIRAALPDIIGFPVESSYINLALEHGVFFGSLITIAFVVAAWRSLQQGLKPGQSQYQLFMAGLMFVFILAQSIFNRYLIGVGNPYSLWILVLILQVNLESISSRTTKKVHDKGFNSWAPGPLPIARETFSHLNQNQTTRIKS